MHFWKVITLGMEYYFSPKIVLHLCVVSEDSPLYLLWMLDRSYCLCMILHLSSLVGTCVAPSVHSRVIIHIPRIHIYLRRAFSSSSPFQKLRYAQVSSFNFSQGCENMIYLLLYISYLNIILLVRLRLSSFRYFNPSVYT